MAKYYFELGNKDGANYPDDGRCVKDEQPDDSAAVKSAWEWWVELSDEGIDMSRRTIRIEDFDGRFVAELWAGD